MFRLVLVLTFLLAFLSAARPEDSKPNIVFILADDVGQECLGVYGGESYLTPQLDHLAKTGMRFRHAYSMPTCFPTRLTFLTGKYPFRFGPTKWGAFPRAADATTLAQRLRSAGYATAVFGKWQLELLKNRPDHARQLGFQTSEIWGWHEGARYYDPMIYR
ncbi:MAG: sulfatase-like hydrolase/transferase, partial [Planctomycetota bacterium]